MTLQTITADDVSVSAGTGIIYTHADDGGDRLAIPAKSVIGWIEHAETFAFTLALVGGQTVRVVVADHDDTNERSDVWAGILKKIEQAIERAVVEAS